MLTRTAAVLLLIFASSFPAFAQGKSGEAHDGGTGQGNVGKGQDQSQQPNQSFAFGQNSATTGLTASAHQVPKPQVLTPAQVLEAVANHQAAPLAELAKSVRERSGGEIIDASLIDTGPELIYVIRVLSRDGALTVQYFHARSARPIGNQ